MIRAFVLACLLAVPAGLSAVPAGADWLVMHDGTRLETEGPWRVKGRQVVFTRADGALAALRLADVDLESSEAATEASRAAAAKPAASKAEREATSKPPARKSILVLTDDDIRSVEATRADDEAGEEADDEAGVEASEVEGGDEAADDEASESASTELAEAERPLEVISWREQESSAVNGTEIVGTVVNRGNNVAAEIRLQVTVPDEEGGVLADIRAFLDKPSLAPGQNSTFRALLPGVHALPEDPTFELSSDGFSITGPARAEGTSDDELSEFDAFTEPGEPAELNDVADPAELDEFADPDDEFADPDDADFFEEEGGGA